MPDWIDILEAEATSRWTDKKLLLASQIPSVLRGKADLPTILAGRTLLAALRLDARDRLTLIQDPANSAVWAVLPKKIGDTTNAETVFSKQTAKETDTSTSINMPKYKPWFWAAFIKVLDPEKKRWMLTDRFVDCETSAPPPSDGFEIFRSDILNPGPGELADKERIVTSIRAWAVRNQIDLQQFEFISAREHVKPTHRRPSLVFDDLAEEDLKRISVPLDIVLKLIRR